MISKIFRRRLFLMLDILSTTSGPNLEGNVDEDEVDKKPEETLNLTGRLVDL